MFHYEFNPGVDITFDQLFPDEKSAKHFLKGNLTINDDYA